MRHGVTRREVLSGLGVGVVGSIAGCSGLALPGGDEPVPGDWPMFGYDAANTGASPDAPGPSGPGERWRFAVDRWTNASPAVAGGSVYVTTLEGTAYAIEASTGEERWRTRASFPLFGTPAVYEGRVYVTDAGGYLHALSEGEDSGRTEGTGSGRSPGEFLWQVRGDAGFSASPTVVDGGVYLGTFEGDLHAFDAGDGTERWRTDVGSGIATAPAVAGGSVYVGTLDSELHAIATDDGTRQWVASTGEGVPRSPAVAGDAVYVTTDASELLAIGP
jgi:outer membrane protein assembly factor BamB